MRSRNLSTSSLLRCLTARCNFQGFNPQCCLKLPFLSRGEEYAVPAIRWSKLRTTTCHTLRTTSSSWSGAKRFWMTLEKWGISTEPRLAYLKLVPNRLSSQLYLKFLRKTRIKKRMFQLCKDLTFQVLLSPKSLFQNKRKFWRLKNQSLLSIKPQSKDMTSGRIKTRRQWLEQGRW